MLSGASPAAGLLGTLAERLQHLEQSQLQCQQDRPNLQQAMVDLLEMWKDAGLSNLVAVVFCFSSLTLSRMDISASHMDHAESWHAPNLMMSIGPAGGKVG